MRCDSRTEKPADYRKLRRIKAMRWLAGLAEEMAHILLSLFLNAEDKLTFVFFLRQPVNRFTI
ncbi:hypothetical protein CU666_05585 [Pseudomonas syringae pv. actinidifoliorum]|nr:hypothetical protein [Pseudomonas syringae pv. actinidifoliorum]